MVTSHAQQIQQFAGKKISKAKCTACLCCSVCIACAVALLGCSVRADPLCSGSLG